MKEQLPTATPGHTGDRCRRRSKELPTGSGAQRAKLFCQESSGRRRGCGGSTRQSEQAGSRIGNQPRLLPEYRFLLEKTFIAPVDQMLDHRMFRAVGLNKHLSGFLSTASPASQLKHELQ